MFGRSHPFASPVCSIRVLLHAAAALFNLACQQQMAQKLKHDGDVMRRSSVTTYNADLTPCAGVRLRAGEAVVQRHADDHLLDRLCGDAVVPRTGALRQLLR